MRYVLFITALFLFHFLQGWDFFDRMGCNWKVRRFLNNFLPFERTGKERAKNQPHACLGLWWHRGLVHGTGTGVTALQQSSKLSQCKFTFSKISAIYFEILSDKYKTSQGKFKNTLHEYI